MTEIKMLSAKGSAKPDSQHYADSINSLQQKHEKIKQFLEKNQENIRLSIEDQTDLNGRERTETDGELRFAISDYSVEEQKDIVDVLKPFVGTIFDKTPAELTAYLKEHDIDIPETDAYAFAKEAARQKMQSVRKAADARASNWLYENVVEYKWAVDFAGGNNFKECNKWRFSPIFAGADEFAGTRGRICLIFRLALFMDNSDPVFSHPFNGFDYYRRSQ